ncbi:hypothetical protein D3C71_1528730 [compost metagenome]
MEPEGCTPTFIPFRSEGLVNGLRALTEIMASGLFWFTATMAVLFSPWVRPTIKVGRSPNPNVALPLATRRSASVVPVPLRTVVRSMPCLEK